MPEVTLRTIKKRLAAAFPDIEFTYGTAGRGSNRGHAVSWVGGPSADAIRVAADCPWRCPVKHFHRQMTDAEWAVQQAQWDAERAAREAAEPSRKAAAKAAGIAKRKETLALKKTRERQLATAFPGLTITLTRTRWGSEMFAWTDGPEVSEVAAVLGVAQHACARTESAEHQSHRLANARLQKRLERARRRATEVANGIVRRQRMQITAIHRGQIANAQQAFVF